jgi:ABC-type lipoprotein release transport system permease subunit
MLFFLAVRNLAQHRKRTLLLGGALAGVTALLVILLALIASIQTTMRESATALVSGDLTVRGFYKITPGQTVPVLEGTPAVMDLIRREVPEVESMAVRARGWGRLVGPTRVLEQSLVGVDVADDPNLRRIIQVKDGDLDQLSRPDAILLFEKAAAKLGVKAGDNVTLSMPTIRGVANTVDLRVVAVARDVGLLSSGMSITSNAAMRQLFQIPSDATSSVHLYLRSREVPPDLPARVRDVLSKAGYRVLNADPQPFFMKYGGLNQEDWTGQKLDVGTWEDEVFVAKVTLPVLTLLSFALTLALLVVICLGVANSLWTSIRERTREIGSLRAIGMQRFQVLRMILAEGFVLGLGGALLGAAVGILACVVFSLLELPVPSAVQVLLMRHTLLLDVQPGAVLVSVFIITASTSFTSLLPSFLAARMKPINAIHHVG